MFCAQSAFSLFHRSFRDVLQSVTLLNSVPRSHTLVRTEINFLCRSLDRPTIEESYSNMRTQKVEKSRTLARVIKEKENKHENQIEVL